MQKQFKILTFSLCLSFFLTLIYPLNLYAQQSLQNTWPNKSVKIIVPFAPGSATDIAARIVGQKLSELWQQQVIIENKPGAGGTLGTNLVAKASADGYTLLAHTNGFVVNSVLYNKLPFDSIKDLTPISPLFSAPFVLIVLPNSGYKSVKDLIADAKAKPGDLMYSTPGVGGAGHFVTEKFRLMAGIEVLHIPNKGAAEAAADLISGRVNFIFSPITTATSFSKEGRVISLGISSAKKSQLLPNIQPIAELGVPGFNETFWTGLWTPAGVPVNIVEKISKDTQMILNSPEIQERFKTLGAEPMLMGQKEFTTFVLREQESADKTVKAAGIKIE
jgi:tripartite-type tricarboxylate transporter receptor subunit TctC